jgi:hypothetical protein
MYASKYVFGKGFFVAWIVVAIIWVWGTMFIAGFYPIIDGWRQLRQVYRGLRTGTTEPAVTTEVVPVQRKGSSNQDSDINASSEG